MILKAIGAAVASLMTATAAAACCAPPILAGIMGTGMAGLGGQLEPYRPLFLGLSAASFGFGLFWVERRADTRCEDGECDHWRARRLSRWVLLTGFALSVAMATYPTWRTWI